MQRILMSSKVRNFDWKQRSEIMNFIRKRSLFKSLVEVMGDERKIHALIWLKASGAYRQVQAHPNYYN